MSGEMPPDVAARITAMTADAVRAAWRRKVPDVTDAEVDTLVPLVIDRRGMLDLAVRAYRAGHTAGEAGR